VLEVGFLRLELPEIVSFTALGNLRSRAVMERIGMRNAGEDFEHPGVPEGHQPATEPERVQQATPVAPTSTAPSESGPHFTRAREF
jgi:RimJ/RimL family protein N-acetyltransferase